jgi:hypothetical protein
MKIYLVFPLKRILKDLNPIKTEKKEVVFKTIF